MTSSARYRRIEEHAIIGDLHTVALVAIDGTISFLCVPSFDSPSVFASLLDFDRGGRFELAAAFDDPTYRQLYLPDTNVLLTRFLDDRGIERATTAYWLARALSGSKDTRTRSLLEEAVADLPASSALKHEAEIEIDADAA